MEMVEAKGVMVKLECSRPRVSAGEFRSLHVMILVAGFAIQPDSLSRTKITTPTPTTSPLYEIF